MNGWLGSKHQLTNPWRHLKKELRQSTSLPCGTVPSGSPSRGGSFAVYAFDINQPSMSTPFYSVLVSISVFVALSTVFHSKKSPDNSSLSHSVLPVLFLSYWSFTLYLFFWKFPFYSVLVTTSVFMALSTVFHSVHSPNDSPFLTLFFRSHFCLIGPFNYISLCDSLLQPWCNP